MGGLVFFGFLFGVIDYELCLGIILVGSWVLCVFACLCLWTRPYCFMVDTLVGCFGGVVFVTMDLLLIVFSCVLPVVFLYL